MQAHSGISFDIVIILSCLIVLLVYILIGLYNDTRLKLLDEIIGGKPQKKQ